MPGSQSLAQRQASVSPLVAVSGAPSPAPGVTQALQRIEASIHALNEQIDEQLAARDGILDSIVKVVLGRLVHDPAVLRDEKAGSSASPLRSLSEAHDFRQLEQLVHMYRDCQDNIDTSVALRGVELRNLARLPDPV